MSKGWIYIALSTILFSTMEISLKLASAGFNPIQLTFLRFMAGSLILCPLAIAGIRSRKIKLGLGDLMFFSLTGFIPNINSFVFIKLLLYSKK